MAGNTGIDPSAVQGMIQKHTQLMDDINGYIQQAQSTVDNDIAATSSGAMVNSLQNVFDNWKQSIQKVQSDLSSMINQLQSTLNSLQSQDTSNVLS